MPHVFFLFYTNLSNNARIVSIGVNMQKLCHSEDDLLISTTIIREDAMLAHPLFMEKGASHMIMMKRNLEASIL